jgi:hypothetical protein
MKTTKLASLLLAGMLGVSACGSGNSSGTDGSAGTETLRGHLVVGGELYAFEPCGTTDLVWADLIGSSPSGAEMLPNFVPSCVDGGTAFCPSTIYVELEGTIASGGGYGRGGKFPQQLTIRRYLNASQTDPADCPFLAPVYP